MNDLVECPFCNSVDISVELREDGFLINDPERKDPRRYKAYAAICNNCGARGPLVKETDTRALIEDLAEQCASIGNFNSKPLAIEQAFELWNQGVARNNAAN